MDNLEDKISSLEKRITKLENKNRRRLIISIFVTIITIVVYVILIYIIMNAFNNSIDSILGGSIWNLKI